MTDLRTQASRPASGLADLGKVSVETRSVKRESNEPDSAQKEFGPI